MTTPYNQEDVETLYMLIGEGIWHLQHLENVLTNFTTLILMERKRKKGKSPSLEDVQSSLANKQKLVFGKLIGAAKHEGAIPELLHQEFDSILDERNWVIHKCVVDEYLSLRNEANKTLLLHRLKTFSSNVQILTKKMSQELEKWYVKSGYDLKKAYQHADKVLKDAEKS